MSKKFRLLIPLCVCSNTSTEDQIQVRIYQGLDVFMPFEAHLTETHKDTCRSGKLQSGDTLLLMHIEDKILKSLMVMFRLYKMYSYLLRH